MNNEPVGADLRVGPPYEQRKPVGADLRVGPPNEQRKPVGPTSASALLWRNALTLSITVWPKLISILVLLLFAVGCWASIDLPAARKKAAHKQRRIIFNNDGDDNWYAKAATPDAYLDVRIRPALKTQVDSMFFCTTEDIGYYLHRGKTAQYFDKDHPGLPISKDVMLTKHLAEQGTDVLQVALDYTHSQKKELIWTLRMNGMEDMVVDWLLGDFKANHPQWWLGTPDFEQKYPTGDPRHWYKVLDYGVPEVREYVLSNIQEVIDNYDIDGVELDYMRDPWLFKETFSDPVVPVTPEHCQIMVEFHKRVREMLDAKAKRIGRALLLAIRVPRYLQISKNLGLDIEASLKSGAIDILVGGGGYIPMAMPTKDFIDLGAKYKVPTYICISASGMRDLKQFEGHRRNSIAAWRGAAINFWDAGVAGQYIFNTFPDGPEPNWCVDVMNEIGDRKAILKKEMLFTLDNRDTFVNAGYCNHAFSWDGLLPVTLVPGKTSGCDFYVGANVSRMRPQPTVSLRVWLTDKTADDTVQMLLNGEPLTPSGTAASGAYTDYAIDPKVVKHRRNRLEARVQRPEGATGDITLSHFELVVTPKAGG